MLMLMLICLGDEIFSIIRPRGGYLNRTPFKPGFESVLNAKESWFFGQSYIYLLEKIH